MPNCTTTQKTLTKLEFFTFFYIYTIYNIYNTIQITIRYTSPSKSLLVGTAGDLYWVYYLIDLAWLINFLHIQYNTNQNENSVCLRLLHNAFLLFSSALSM